MMPNLSKDQWYCIERWADQATADVAHRLLVVIANSGEPHLTAEDKSVIADTKKEMSRTLADLQAIRIECEKQRKG